MLGEFKEGRIGGKRKYLDCFNCICLDCYEEFNTEECSRSDCEWCQNEKGQWAERCNKYLEKGGTYGEKPNN